MHALLDCDIFCYEIGPAKGEDGETPLDWPLVQWRVDARIEQILEATEATSWKGYLTGKGNYRERDATIIPYKGPRRLKERPFWYQGIYDYLATVRGCDVIHGMEADDGIALAHYVDSTIVCSRDKDLLQLPGWHYVWESYMQLERTPFYVSEIEAIRNLYKQMLQGDQSDNILGLYGVGKKSALLQHINEMDSEEQIKDYCIGEYRKRFGSHWQMFWDENWMLLRLLRREDGNKIL